MREGIVRCGVRTVVFLDEYFAELKETAQELARRLEAVYRSFEGIESMTFQLTKRAGRATLSGQDFVDLERCQMQFDIVCVFSPTHDARLLRNP